MKTQATKYAQAAYELGISADAFRQIADLLTSEESLNQILMDPTVSVAKKEAILTKVMETQPSLSKVLVNLFLYLNRHGQMGNLQEISRALEAYQKAREGVLSARLYCVTEPEADQQAGIESWLKREFHKEQVELEIIPQPDLIGGFIVEAEGIQYDRSVAGAMRNLTRKIGGN